MAAVGLMAAGSPEIDNFKRQAIGFCMEMIARIDQLSLENQALRSDLDAVREMAICRG